MSRRSAARTEVTCAALAALGAGILALTADVGPRVATVIVALSYAVVSGTLFPLVGRFARLGCTRIGSPGIFGYSGG